jgi:hypothetical protein
MSTLRSSEKSDFWTVRRRLLTSYATVILITMGLGGYAFNRLRSIEQDSEEVSRRCLPGLYLLNQIDFQIGRIYSLTLKHVNTTNAEESTAIVKQLQSNMERMNRCVEQFKVTVTTSRDQAALDSMQAARARYTRLRSTCFARLRKRTLRSWRWFDRNSNQPTNCCGGD